MACRLIINADDFGWSEGANASIVALHEAGIVTSASLMVGGPAAEDAVRQARGVPSLAVGLHVAAVHAPSFLPPAEVPHLVDRRGWFPVGAPTAALRYTFLPVCRRELRRELAAQFARFRELGFAFSHVDTHLHLGLTPVVLAEVLRRCDLAPVVGFRVPEDDYALYRRMDPAGARRKRLVALAFSALCRPMRGLLARRPLVTTQRCYGFFRTGRLDAEYLTSLVRALPDGELELHCHPDLSTPGGRREHLALLSDAFRAALVERGVVLSTYESLRAARDSRAGAHDR